MTVNAKQLPAGKTVDVKLTNGNTLKGAVVLNASAKDTEDGSFDPTQVTYTFQDAEGALHVYDLDELDDVNGDVEQASFEWGTSEGPAAEILD